MVVGISSTSGWTLSETSVVGVEEGGDPWKILLDNIASEVEVSSLADVSKDKNETEEFLSAVSSNDEADDIAKNEAGQERNSDI